jgi:excisionase family DNA binding protein
MADFEGPYLTTAEAAERSGYSRDTIIGWILRGELPATRNTRNQYRIPVAALDAVLAKKKRGHLATPATPRKRLAAFGHSLSRNQIGAAVIATLIATAIISVFQQSWADPPQTVAATLDTVRVTDPQITLRDFIVDYFDLHSVPEGDNDALRAALREHRLPSEVTDDALRTVGLVVTFDVTFEGLRSRQCSLKWSVYDARTKHPLPDAYLRDQPAFPHHLFTPQAQRDSASDKLWIPRPPRAGPFFVTLELRDDAAVDQRVPLAHAETQAFT